MSHLSNGSGPKAGAISPLADPNRLGRAARAGGAGVWEWHLLDDMLYFDQRLGEMLGLDAGVGQISAARFFGLAHQDDAALLKVEIGEAKRGDRAFSHEFRIERADNGGLRWLCFQGRVLERDEEARPAVMAGLCFDVTERRHAQETHDLLNRELSHRLKNLLSVIGSLAVMTGEHRPEAREFVASFQARLSNLAAAHDLLVQADWQPVALARLVERALGPIGVLDRIDLCTNDLVLGSYDAQTVVLLLHELSTNAIKYGALSNASGRVKLDFEVKPPANPTGAPLLLLVWEENGGPSVTPPPSKGFGVSLLERLARSQDPGTPVLDWRATGLRCSITLPISPPRRR